MPVVKVNGIDLHIQIVGESGPLLFMCHGLVSGSVATWYFQFAPMLARHYRVVMYDMRGHGRSEKVSAGFDIDTMADDLLALIRYCQQQFAMENCPVNIVGHSYGALVALRLAVDVATSAAVVLDRLVVVDAPLPAAKYIAPGMANIHDMEAVQQLTEQLCVSLALEGARSRRRLLAQLEYLYLKTSMKADIAASGDIEDEMLTRISAPVLLIYGQYSDCLHAGKRLQRLIEKSELKIFPCGHYVTLEQPHLLATEMNQFFGVRD